MANGKPKGRPIYIGTKDNQLHKDYDQAVADYKASKANASSQMDKKQITEQHIDHLMDIGMDCKEAGDWELVRLVSNRVDSLMSRIYRPRKSRF